MNNVYQKIRELEYNSKEKRRIKLESAQRRDEITVVNTKSILEYKALAKDLQRWISDEKYPNAMKAVEDIKILLNNQLRDAIRLENKEKRNDICLVIGAKLDLLDELQKFPLQIIKNVEEMDKAIKG